MAAVEDEQDVAAARLATDEARADRAEFDDRVGGGNGGNDSGNNGVGVSEEKPDDKYMELINQLKPIERYAVNFLEAEYKPEFEEEVKETEAQIEQKKEDWQRAHEKTMAAGEAADNAEGVDDFYGYGNMLDEILADGPGVFDEMPSWAPLTPLLSSPTTMSTMMTASIFFTTRTLWEWPDYHPPSTNYTGR